MTLLSSLTNRVFAATASLIVVAMGLAIYRVSVSVATQAETAAVYRKLKAAARKVCGVETGHVVSLDERMRAKECVNEALADVVRRLNRPMLTSVHEATAGKVG